MRRPINYYLDHSAATVDLTLTGERLITKTRGKGLMDKPRTIDIPLSDLKNFCLVPTIAAQNLVTSTTAGDRSYDSEFIFSYHDQGKLKKKRIFVNSRDKNFQGLVEDLRGKCPAASLLHLEPGEAQKQIGALSAKKALYIAIGLIVGVPLLSALIFVISKMPG
jgi:hypothetical protein